MSRREESIPFAFVAESERFRSNVAPPPRRRPSPSQLAGNVLLGLVVVAGLVGSLLLGVPALQAQPGSGGAERPAASEGR